MVKRIEVIGVYPIHAEQPVHLVELILHGCDSSIDMAGITQEIPGLSRDSWQVPYEERILDSSGERIVADPFFERDKLDIWTGNVRIAFFFHYLDLSRPLQTPLGLIMLPEPTHKPSRLSIMTYEPVD